MTTPVAATTEAIAGLLLTQVPPELGDKVVVEPTQMVLAPAILVITNELTVTADVVALQLGDTVLVKVNVAIPAPTPVTTPPLVTVATDILLLTQVPPVVGDKVVVLPAQIVLAPTILTTGNAVTVRAEVGAETQPVAVFVKVKVAVPAETPVTTPVMETTVATAGLLLVQVPVPPPAGDNMVVLPTQIVLAPAMLTTGVAFTVTGAVAAEAQPDAVAVKVKVTVPPDTPVTTPALVIVAIAGLLLAQVPPEVGETLVMPPTQILLEPTRLTVGATTITMEAETVAVQPPPSLTVTV